MFSETKKLNDHHWHFLGEQRGGGRLDPNKRIHCRCELCGTDHWPMWRTVKEGTSTRCLGCSKKLTPRRIAEFNTKFEHEKIIWRLTGECQSTGTGHRAYRAICGGCNKAKWLDWSMLQQMRSHPCPSCGQRKRMTGTYIPKVRTEREAALYHRFLALQSNKDTKHVPFHWKTFEEFEKWAYGTGFKLGARLNRKSRTGPYSPENCYWSFVGVEEKQEAKQNFADLLPMGISIACSAVN